MIRKLHWNDLDDLVNNYYEYYDEVQSDPDFGIIFFKSRPDYGSEVVWFTDLYSEMIRGDAIAVVAEVEGRVVGICDIHRLRPNSELSHNGVLGIAVKKEYRNRGIGKDLIKMVLELSRRKFEMIRLEVFTVNSAAISLYRKLGFKEYGVSPSAVKRGDRYYDLLMMYYKF